MAEAFAACCRSKTGELPALAVVHAYSTHNLLLRYWLATAGMIAERDVPCPSFRRRAWRRCWRTDESSASAPARPGARSRPGPRSGPRSPLRIIFGATRRRRRSPCARSWAERHPEDLQRALRALFRAAKFCDAPENASYTAALLSQEGYLDVSGHAILSSLPGGASSESASVFHRGLATFPWRSQALWFLLQLSSWGLLDASLATLAVAAQVYRPDIYKAARAARRADSVVGAGSAKANMRRRGRCRPRRRQSRWGRTASAMARCSIRRWRRSRDPRARAHEPDCASHHIERRRPSAGQDNP